MPLDHYVTLGRSGLRVSPLCLGAMTFGTEWGFGCSPEDSVRLIDAYLDRAGNFIDTANLYTRGHAEKIIGDHIGRHPAKRDRTVIATKFCGNLYRDDPNAGGAGRKAIFQQVEHSLRRLQTDYIDLYWLHFWDSHTPIDETMRALDDLVRAGKVRHIGFSDTPAWKCVQAQALAESHGWSPIVTLQLEYSLLERTIEGELIPMGLEYNLGLCPWSPLKGGILTGKYTRESIPKPGEARYKEDSRYLTEETFAIVDQLVETGKAVGATPAQVALKWVQDRPLVASSIIGARTMKQLEDNLAALDVEIPEEHAAKLEELSRPKLNFPHDFLEGARVAIHGGMTVNSVTPPVWELCPEKDSERY
jgi:aryl-alcohol dehydrogenase-like predicted oxidoreductase